MFKNPSSANPAASRLKLGYVVENSATRLRSKFRDKNSLQRGRTDDFYHRFINSLEPNHRRWARRRVRVCMKSSWPVGAMATVFY